MLKKILKDLGLPEDVNLYRTDGKFEDEEGEITGNLYQHAKREMAGWENNFSKIGLLELIAVFSKQGHSGGSAPITIETFKELASFKPLTPLTGKDDEWNEVRHGEWQNKRLSSVFKDKDGKAYDIDAFRIENEDGWGSGVKAFIEFPYTQQKKVVQTKSQKDYNNLTKLLEVLQKKK